MRVQKRMDGGVVVVTLTGSLDGSSAGAVEADLAELVPGGGRVLLDLGAMSYVSSAGLRILLLTHRLAQRRGARLALAGVPPDVHEVLAATGFLQFFTVADTVCAGLEALTA
jgi:anti-anti-sigma factor